MGIVAQNSKQTSNDKRPTNQTSNSTRRRPPLSRFKQLQIAPFFIKLLSSNILLKTLDF